MQRILSPSRRPFESGAARWQHLSSSATMRPALSRHNSSGAPVMVRASMPSAAISCDHAATYQVFFRKWLAMFIAVFLRLLSRQRADQFVERPIESRRKLRADDRLDVPVCRFDLRGHTRAQGAAARRKRDAQPALIVREPFALDEPELFHARQHT